MLKGLIVIPKVYAHSWIVIRRYFSLFDLIKKKFGWQTEITDDIDPDKITADVVMTFKSPQKNTIDSQGRIYKLSKDIKLICYNIDLHNFGDIGRVDKPEFNEACDRIFGRANKIISPFNNLFLKKWPQYTNKFEFFPLFVDQKTYLELEFNESPINKCLLTGCITGDIYPLRKFVLENKNSSIDCIPHPGYGKNDEKDATIDEDYAIELNKYLCGVTDSSMLNCIVNKYFEIPASSSLLLANYSPDLDYLGFKDGENYIQVDINGHDFLKKLNDVINNPSLYYDIRQNGRKFILDNHTDKHRFEQFKRILKEVMDE